MKLVILDGKTLGNDLDLSPLKAFGELTIYETTTSEETLERVKDVDVIITNKVIIDQNIMKNCPNLKLIAVTATGVNNIDLDTAKELKIAVKNVEGYSTNSVLQHTFTMALHLMSHMDYYKEIVTNGQWSHSGLFTDVSKPFNEISGKAWGVIGFGTIGKEVARMAELFGATVTYYSTSGRNKINDYHHDNLDELLSKSDIVSIHAPLNSDTLNLINQSNLGLLKDGAILLNLGRGGIVNEKDLANELNRRELYAGLDVLSVEPIEEDNPLLKIEHSHRLLITPHIAWASVEAREKLLKGVIENIKSCFHLKKLNLI
jgi:glycerate dehydrogenase